MRQKTSIKSCDLLFAIILLTLSIAHIPPLPHKREKKQKRNTVPSFQQISRDAVRLIDAASKMKGFLAFLLCLNVASGFILKFEEDQLQWEAWKRFHGKSYASESEEEMRKAIWRENLKVVLYPKNQIFC